MLASMESTRTPRDHYEEDAMFGVEVYYWQSGTWAMRLNLKLLLLVISICNFASFILHLHLHLHRFDFKRPKPTTSFPGCVYTKKQRGRVSVGFVRVTRVPGRPAGSIGFRRVNSSAGFYLDPDRSQARVGRVPGRPAGPVRVSKQWYL